MKKSIASPSTAETKKKESEIPFMGKVSTRPKKAEKRNDIKVDALLHGSREINSLNWRGEKVLEK